MLKDYFEVPNKPAIKSGNVLSCDFTDHETFIPQPLDFTRNTLATYIDCNGLIKVSGVSDTELVTNGDFATNSDWTLTSSANIASGKLNVSAGAFDFFAIQTALTNGGFYKISVEVLVTSGSVLLYTGSQFATITISGVYNYYVTADSTLIRLRSSGSGFVGSISNVSAKEVDLNVPRIDYLTEIGKARELQKPSLLLEPQRTNLVQKSNDVSNGSGNYLLNFQINSSNNLSPEGINNAQEIEVTATSQPRVESVTTSNATIYSVSGYVKKVTGDFFGIGFYQQDIGNQFAKFDLSTGTFVAVSSNGAVSQSATNIYNCEIIAHKNNWYRITCNILTGSSASKSQIKWLGMKAGTNASSFSTGVLGDKFLIYGRQVEQADYTTSYIPTSGSTVTRNVELCDNAGQRGVFNNEEGTMYVEFTELGFTNPNQTSIVVSQENSSNNRVLLFRGGGSNWSFQIRAAGVNVVSNSINLTTTETLNKFAKVAIRYKSGEITAFVNGSQSFTNSSTFTFNGGLFKFGFVPYDSAVNNNFYGRVKDVKVFRRTLTDSEMAELTNNIT